MPVDGPVPEWLFAILAGTTLFAVMFDIGVAIVPRDVLSAARRPLVLAKSVFAVVVAVPAIAWLVCRGLDLPRNAEIGIMLMAISPGAPVALRRSLAAGGHPAFAATLQVLVVAIAIVSMPLFVAFFSEYYAGTARSDHDSLARQVFFAQLLPLALGVACRRLAPASLARFEPTLHRIAGWLLAALVLLALVSIWRHVADAHWRLLAAVVAITGLALACGHALGGGSRSTRTTTAISCGMRNAGLALLVAALNRVPEAIIAAVLAYFIVAAVTVSVYIIWRRGRAPSLSSGEAHGED